jgi:hypothetical protein
MDGIYSRYVLFKCQVFKSTGDLEQENSDPSDRNPLSMSGIANVHLADPPLVLASDRLRVSRATCKVITPRGRGTAFLVEFRLAPAGSPLSGLLTTNCVFDSSVLVHHSSIDLLFELSGPAKSFPLVLKPTQFCFTDRLLGCTFIAIAPEEITELGGHKIDFLEIEDSLLRDDDVFVVREMRGENVAIVQGRVHCAWGFDYLHELNTELGLSGSPICTPSGRVAGLHKVSRANLGTRIHSIKLALAEAMSEPQLLNWRKGPRVCLTIVECQELEEYGLVRTANPLVFTSPATPDGVTCLWFFRTHHAWYWTPQEPTSVDDLNALRMCNWSVILNNGDIRVIGGHWDGRMPAKRNIALVQWLIDTKCRFLH